MQARRIEKDKFDDFKTKFYRLQGWGTETGYPTRKTLDSVSLTHVANELERKGRQGKADIIDLNALRSVISPTLGSYTGTLPGAHSGVVYINAFIILNQVKPLVIEP